MSLELEKRKKKSSTQRKEEKYSFKLTTHPLVPNFSLEDQFFSDYLTVGNVSEILEFAEFPEFPFPKRTACSSKFQFPKKGSMLFQDPVSKRGNTPFLAQRR